MAEPIGALRVELSAGWAGLEKGFRQASKQTKTLGKTLKGLEKPLGDLAKGAGLAFAAVGAAAAAAGAGIIKLGSRGAVVADVASAFDSLTDSVGGTADEMLGALRRGVSNTLTDFELMSLANKALGAGLVGTADDFEVLAAGARLLAKRTGGDTKQAFETMTNAMASGRTAQLKQLGLFVDSKQAIEDYALSLGKAEEDLNDADRAMALQIATLKVLRDELENNAPAAADFGEKIEQLKVEVENLFDSFAVMISELPAITALLEGLTDIFSGLTDEVGKSQESLGELVTKGVIAFADGMVLAADAAQLAVDVFDSLQLVWKSSVNLALKLALAVEKANEAYLRFATIGTKQLILQSKTAQAAIKLEIAANAKSVDAVVKGSASKTNAIQKLRGRLADLAKNVANAGREEVETARDTRVLKTEVDALATSTKEVTKETAAWAKLLKDEVSRTYDQLSKDLKELEADLAASAKAMRDADLAQLADEAATSYELMAAEMKRVAEEAQALKDAKLQGVFTGLVLVAGAVNDNLEQTAVVLGNVAEAFRNAKTDAEKFYAAAQAAGQIGGIIGGGFGKFLQGAAGGASVGAIFGPWGAAIGGVIGGVATLFNKSGEALNDLRDQFFETQGGWEALAARLREVTDEDLIARIFDARTVDEFNAAVQAVKDTFDLAGEAQRELQLAIEKYGFTIDQLGPAMQRQELDRMAAQLLKEWELLIASGININDVIAAMGPNILDFLQKSIAAGHAIPLAMKPMVDKLIESGQLLDENGNAFGSAEEAGIEFTESITDGLARMIDAIDRLVAALTGIPPVNLRVNVNYREHNRPSDVPGVPEFQHGGVGNFGAGTLAMLHGREAVVPLGAGAAWLGSDPAILEELRGIREDMRDAPRSTARAVRDALTLAPTR